MQRISVVSTNARVTGWLDAWAVRVQAYDQLNLVDSTRFVRLTSWSESQLLGSS